MAVTYQQVCDLGRLPLNDDDKDRYTDAQLLLYAQTGIALLIDKRPDLFFGDYAALPDPFDDVIGDNIPIDVRYKQALADYVTAGAETHDDENILAQRAQLFFQLAAGQT